jgi:MoaA/NifB/PqqE/SkfB family radical SAM enzyme
MEENMLRIHGKWALFRALLSGRAGLSKPLFVTLDITPRCNLTCVGCRHHSQWLTSEYQLGPAKSDMSLDVVEQITSKLNELGGIMLYLEGSGEPFIHPQIMDIVRRLKKAGFCLTIFTNGILLNANLVKELIEARVNFVRFSIWAGAESTFERNYPGSNKKNFSRITESLQHFRLLRQQHGSVYPKLHLYFIINKLNKDEIPIIVELADQYHCDSITFGQFISWGKKMDSISFDSQERTALMEELKRYKTVLKKKSLGQTIVHDIKKLATGPESWLHSPCLVCWFHMRILGNGDVVPCCRSSYRLGNIIDHSFAEIWDGQAINEFRRRAAAPDGHEWLKEQGTDCHDCPHIVEMKKLYNWMRVINKIMGHRN